jgi:hypothetical protein
MIFIARVLLSFRQPELRLARLAERHGIATLADG